MNNKELTKLQKKQAKALIDKALIRDYTDRIKKIKNICDSFDERSADPREFYHKLYSAIQKKDKEIARRYDDLTGSKYLMRLMILIEEGVLTKEDIADLDDELKRLVSE